MRWFERCDQRSLYSRGHGIRRVPVALVTGGWPGSAYRVSKVALNAQTRIQAEALRRKGIAVNAVCPGWVKSAMGGPAASRPVHEGADTIVWAATEVASERTGGFFRDRAPTGW